MIGYLNLLIVFRKHLRVDNYIIRLYNYYGTTVTDDVSNRLVRSFKKLQNVIGYTVVPMDIGFSVDRQPLVIGQFLAPFLLVAVKCPVVGIEAAPKNSAPVSVKILFAYDTEVVCLYIHYAHCVISPAADGDGISPDYIEQERLARGGDNVSLANYDALWLNMRFIAAIVFAESPIINEAVAVKKGVKAMNAIAHMALGEIAAMRIGKLRNKFS